MKKFAVFGNPIAHSKSPEIHQAFAKQFGIELSYERILTPFDRFAEALKDFYDQGGLGANITVPFKEEAWIVVDQKTSRAEQAGAVNTITFLGENNWQGDNTDGIGLLRDLTQNCQIPVMNQNILIIGAGGATRGILLPLLSASPTKITIANRTLTKAKHLAEIFKSHGNLTASTFTDLKEEKFSLILNATSAGIKGEELNVPGEIIKNAIFYDLAYGKSGETFLSWAQKYGCEMCYDGLGMLVEQAAEAFNLWHGVMPETKSVIRELRGYHSAP